LFEHRRAAAARDPPPGRFGSDTPFRLMHVQLAKYRALLRDYGPEAQVLRAAIFCACWGKK